MAWEPWRRAEIQSNTKMESISAQLIEVLGRAVRGLEIHGVVLAVATHAGVEVSLLFPPRGDREWVLPYLKQAITAELEALEFPSGYGGMVN